MARKQRIQFLLIIFCPSFFFRIGPRLAFLLTIRNMKSLSHILVGGCEIAFNGDTREASASAPPARYRPLSISHNFLQTITCSIANCCRRISPRLIYRAEASKMRRRIALTVYGLVPFISVPRFEIVVTPSRARV